MHRYTGLNDAMTLKRRHVVVLQLICSYIFWPVAIIMGVDTKDATHVGRLIGTKVFVDEFVSFTDLNEMVIHNVISVRNTPASFVR